MEADTIVQLVTVVVAAMGIVWHQQHSTTQLRSEFREDNRQLREDNRQLREDFNTANRELREDFREEFKVLRDDHDKLSDAVAQNGQRLARIEGHLGIGVPSSDDASEPELPRG